MISPGELAKAVMEEMLNLGFVPRSGDGMAIMNRVLALQAGEAPAKASAPVTSGTVGAVSKSPAK